MLQIRRYLKILGESRKIIDDYGSFPDAEDNGYRAAVLIYETAFLQLAGCGLPMSKDKDALKIDTDGDTFILRRKSSSEPCSIKRSVKKEAREIGTVITACENPDKADGNVLFTEIRDEVISETQSRKEGVLQEDAGNKESDGEDTAFMEEPLTGEEKLPEDYGMDETEARNPADLDESWKSDEIGTFKVTGRKNNAWQTDEKKDTGAEGDEDTAGNVAEGREELPETGGYNMELLEGVETEYGHKEPAEMPDHMYKEDFTFSYTDIRITGANGKEAQGQVIAAPLSIDEEYPRIICCTIQGEKSETVLSENNRMRILVGGTPVKVEGRMEDGCFKSSFVLPAHYLLEGSRIEAKTRDFGTKGHILLEEREENLQIHIIPATFRNNSSGNAEYIYYINNNGKETAGDTSVVKEASFMLGGKEYEIRCRWSADGILYSMAAEKGDGVGTDSDVQQRQDAARP